MFLSDVVVLEEIADAEAFPITWREAFRRSRWFTRGWTLQELLAPPCVEFFSKDGKQLGSRILLEQEIHETTKIPIGVLRGQSLTEFSVDERMSWAARRTTTLKEDGTLWCVPVAYIWRRRSIRCSTAKRGDTEAAARAMQHECG